MLLYGASYCHSLLLSDQVDPPLVTFAMVGRVGTVCGGAPVQPLDPGVLSDHPHHRGGPSEPVPLLELLQSLRNVGQVPGLLGGDAVPQRRLNHCYERKVRHVPKVVQGRGDDVHRVWNLGAVGLLRDHLGSVRRASTLHLQLMPGWLRRNAHHTSVPYVADNHFITGEVAVEHGRLAGEGHPIVKQGNVVAA
eukprot:CAMPEP_0197892084 /NCGR_PEP_ID=MMETSP1439-20131203/29957_1 /TAXON_ID=66791 /ORGANISM="Gonyaulax spinifera, Strain CCMP409" /LENGTH=192 /DNA_ID=CAMNT_0043512233 /DNA_START=182 /DNA_END=760 /DNA_ORIENTATION=-